MQEKVGLTQNSLPETERSPSINLSPEKEGKIISKKSMRSNNGLTIERILSDQKLKAAFYEHLSREFCLENIMFIEVVKTLKESFSTNTSSTDLLVEIEKIINQFFKPNSVNELNLPREIIKRTLLDAEQMRQSESLQTARNMFDGAYSHIVTMITLDQFRKFARSPLFQPFKENSIEASTTNVKRAIN